MLDRNLWGEFKKVEFTPKARTTGYVTISENKRSLRISAKFINELPWIDGERVDLYRFGETFALKPNKVGLATVHIKPSGANITSTNMCLEILSKTRSCKKFDAWTEEDILFFKPWKGEEQC